MTGQTGRRQVDYCRVAGRQYKRAIAYNNKSRRADVEETGGFDVWTADQRRTEAGPIGTEVQCREELGKR